MQADAARFLGDTTLTVALGPVDKATIFASVADVTSVVGAAGSEADHSLSNPGDSSRAGGTGGEHGGVDVAADLSDRRLVPVCVCPSLSHLFHFS